MSEWLVHTTKLRTIMKTISSTIYPAFVFVLLASFSLLTDRPLSAASMTTVHVVGDAAGLLPPPYNSPVGIHITVDVQGGSVAALEGSGASHATTRANNVYHLTGSVIGTVVQLSGTIVKSDDKFLEGSPAEVEADTTTGTLTVTLGPLAGGPLAGQTLVLEGSGMAFVTGN